VHWLSNGKQHCGHQDGWLVNTNGVALLQMIALQQVACIVKERT
jgi:hypothetical protein